MTHSGGQPHAVGDRGQRYEVRATGYPFPEKSVIGWSDRQEKAERMARAILCAPRCTGAEIYDRVTDAIIPVIP